MHMPLVLTNRRRRGGSASAPAFSPSTLFSTTAIGIWLDPSDLSTMFSDRAGTTAVTTPGTVVGLRLDKSKGLTLGAELVDTANTAAAWVIYGTNTVSQDGDAVRVNFVDNVSGAYLFLNQSGGLNANLVAGKTYQLQVQLRINSGSANFAIYATALGNYIDGQNITDTAYVTRTFTFQYVSGSPYIQFANLSAGESIWIRNISVRELAGNHAVAPTDAARPIYGVEPKGGRRNLLTWSEDFRNTAAAGETRPWTYTSTAVTPNADGVAELVYPTTSGTTRGIERLIGAVSSAAHATSIEAKASGLTWLYLYGGQGNSLAYFNLSTGAVGTVGSGLTAAITGPDAGGYYRCSVTQTCTSLSFYAGGCDANGSTQATASGTNGVLLRNAQLELGSTATAYQRVTTAYDITESGVTTCHYVQYDGSDDSMSTAAIDFTATDKMSVFAGVRKLGTVGIIAELSADLNSNNGTFYLMNGEVAAADMAVGLRGTTTTKIIGSSATVPISRVETASFDIAGASRVTEIFPRINGAAVSGSGFGSADAGTGNFGNYPMFFARRGGTGAAFYGRDFGIIIVGKAASAGEITDTETWLAAKTSGVTL